ncbi:MAG: hypothetical protein KDK78_10420 [Chlamydiia bacterium]|nr:hypothetical protein [Chlamydiia bacterium]
MLFPRLFAFTLLCFSSLSAASFTPATNDLPPRIQPKAPLDDPSRSIEALISCTERKLMTQRDVAEHLKAYSELRDRLLSHPDNPTLAAEVVSKADQLSSEIEEGQLADLFSEDFLQDLHFFATIAQRSQKRAR